MFDRLPGQSITERWAVSWRRRKGIDRWPLVEATVIGRMVIPGDEGPDRYKLSLRFRPPSGPTSDTFWYESLTVDTGTTLASAYPSDKVLIHCHPEDPTKIAQKDVSQLSRDIRTYIFFAVVALFVLWGILFGHWDWGGGD